MIRRIFLGRLLAALGVGVLPSRGASGVTPLANARGVTPPPAPPVPGEMVYVTEYWGNGVHVTYVDGVEVDRELWRPNSVPFRLYYGEPSL